MCPTPQPHPKRPPCPRKKQSLLNRKGGSLGWGRWGRRGGSAPGLGGSITCWEVSTGLAWRGSSLRMQFGDGLRCLHVPWSGCSKLTQLRSPGPPAVAGLVCWDSPGPEKEPCPVQPPWPLAVRQGFESLTLRGSTSPTCSPATGSLPCSKSKIIALLSPPPKGRSCSSVV